ncbi:hypothetical protein Vi05172_g12774 [Venturia inaequalis]|nr:hypothetical protein Vi05172_g12774 [Venturia inaequalis]
MGNTNREAPTICKGKSLDVTLNLRDGLCKMRYADCSRYLWADAICIDQKNMQERGHQIEHVGHA